jgi:putative NIF3 family GTP cyclohydrolase 1 type 2
VTAQDIVTRIQQKVASLGITWHTPTRDVFKAGSPQTEVKAIATTGMATFDAIKRSAAAGRNFVITHEPTFYSDGDQTASLEGDAMYQEKQRFIKDHDMVVFRFHDHAHMLRPDPLAAGAARMLGLTQYAIAAEPRMYEIPQTTLRALAVDFAGRLKGHAIRVVGNPDTPVRRLLLSPGYSTVAINPSIDVAVVGENSEVGGIAEYALDATASGRPTGVILLGHIQSEDWGMREVADWLKTFVTEVSIDWIPAGEPFTAT